MTANDLTTAGNDELLREVYDYLRVLDYLLKAQEARQIAMLNRVEIAHLEILRRMRLDDIAVRGRIEDAAFEILSPHRNVLIQRGLLAPGATLGDLRDLVMPEAE